MKIWAVTRKIFLKNKLTIIQNNQYLNIKLNTRTEVHQQV